jgi:mycofactocin precursor
MQEPSERPFSTAPADAVATAATAPVAAREAEVAELDPSEDDAELEELLIREITIDGMCGVY